jgi:putative transposase
MGHWRCFYHVVWATKLRVPIITRKMEEFLYRYIVKYARKCDSYVLAVNGMPDHVHVVIAIPPKHSVSNVIGRIKGASSRLLGKEFQMEFRWQESFSTYTIGPRGLKAAIEYVERQKEHHLEGTPIPELERIFDDGDEPPGFEPFS